MPQKPKLLKGRFVGVLTTHDFRVWEFPTAAKRKLFMGDLKRMMKASSCGCIRFQSFDEYRKGEERDWETFDDFLDSKYFNSKKRVRGRK